MFFCASESPTSKLYLPTPVSLIMMKCIVVCLRPFELLCSAKFKFKSVSFRKQLYLFVFEHFSDHSYLSKAVTFCCFFRVYETVFSFSVIFAVQLWHLLDVTVSSWFLLYEATKPTNWNIPRLNITTWLSLDVDFSFNALPIVRQFCFFDVLNPAITSV